MVAIVGSSHTEPFWRYDWRPIGLVISEIRVVLLHFFDPLSVARVVFEEVVG